MVKTAARTRPRGFSAWKPRGETRSLLDAVDVVLDTFRDYLPVTVRQIFYRLVATSGYPKTERAYSRLGDILVRARRAGLVPFEAIRDDGLRRSRLVAWSGPREWCEAVLASARGFRRDRQHGQPRRLFLWCEAGGMLPQVARVADEFSVPVLSSGGFDSLTVKHDVAKEIASAGPATVLHIGDLDPSGVHMFGSLDEDVRSFVATMCAGEDLVEFQRLAVTPELVELLDLTMSPAKQTDRRSFTESGTVQAEAIPPNVLADLVREAIESRLDRQIYEATVGEETRQRGGLTQAVSEFLEDL